MDHERRRGSQEYFPEELPSAGSFGFQQLGPVPFFPEVTLGCTEDPQPQGREIARQALKVLKALHPRRRR